MPYATFIKAVPTENGVTVTLKTDEENYLDFARMHKQTVSVDICQPEPSEATFESLDNLVNMAEQLADKLRHRLNINKTLYNTGVCEGEEIA